MFYKITIDTKAAAEEAQLSHEAQKAREFFAILREFLWPQWSHSQKDHGGRQTIDHVSVYVRVCSMAAMNDIQSVNHRHLSHNNIENNSNCNCNNSKNTDQARPDPGTCTRIETISLRIHDKSRWWCMYA